MTLAQDKFLQDGTGAVNRTVDDKLLETVSVLDFGAIGDGITDDTVAIQAALDAMLLTGGTLYFPTGTYDISSQLDLDISGITTSPTGGTTRVNIIGDGQGNTILNGTTASMVILKITGAGSGQTHGYSTIRDIGFTGTNDRLATGLEIQNSAYLSLENLGFHNFGYGLYLTGCISSKFSGLIFNESTYGVLAQENSGGGGTSDPNANAWYGCIFRTCTVYGYQGLEGMSNGLFSGCNFEGCGTQSTVNTGGLTLSFDASAGEVGVTFIGCYFESNKGDFDVRITESGSTRRITAVCIGCNFNRVSSTAYVTNNIRTAGDVSLTTTGCSFAAFNTYVPDVSRLFLDLSSATRHVDVNSRYYSAIAGVAVDAPEHYISEVYAGEVDGATPANSILPSGWSVVNSGTGIFTITHNIGHTGYALVATASDSLVRSVQRITKNANSCIVRMVSGGTTTLTDADFTFMLSLYQPRSN